MKLDQRRASPCIVVYSTDRSILLFFLSLSFPRFSFSRVDLVDLSREGEGFVGDFNAFEKALLVLLNR